MSFILLAVAAVAAASAAGAALARRSMRGARPDDAAPDAATGDASPGAPAKAKASSAASAVAAKKRAEAVVFDGLPVALSDVVSFDHDERWLAGAVVARDGVELVGVLYVAPEGVHQEAVAAFPPPRRDILWLSPSEIESGSEPPSSADFGGVVMRRKARVPVQLTRMGQGAPDVGDTGIWAEYEATGGARAIVIRCPNQVFAWSGVRCDEGEYDRMGRGEGP